MLRDQSAKGDRVASSNASALHRATELRRQWAWRNWSFSTRTLWGTRCVERSATRRSMFGVRRSAFVLHGYRADHSPFTKESRRAIWKSPLLGGENFLGRSGGFDLLCRMRLFLWNWMGESKATRFGSLVLSFLLVSIASGQAGRTYPT